MALHRLLFKLIQFVMIGNIIRRVNQNQLRWTQLLKCCPLYVCQSFDSFDHCIPLFFFAKRLAFRVP